jgi:hypothetical protein
VPNQLLAFLGLVTDGKQTFCLWAVWMVRPASGQVKANAVTTCLAGHGAPQCCLCQVRDGCNHHLKQPPHQPHKGPSLPKRPQDPPGPEDSRVTQAKSVEVRAEKSCRWNSGLVLPVQGTAGWASIWGGARLQLLAEAATSPWEQSWHWIPSGTSSPGQRSPRSGLCGRGGQE